MNVERFVALRTAIAADGVSHPSSWKDGFPTEATALKGAFVLTARLMQVWTSVAERGRQLLRLSPNGAARRIDFLAADLLSERGEATNTARAEAIIRLYEKLGKEQRDGFHRYLAQNFLPDTECLKAAAEAYLAEPSAETARQLALVSESPRLELIRRLNVAPGATAALERFWIEITHIRHG